MLILMYKVVCIYFLIYLASMVLNQSDPEGITKFKELAFRRVEDLKPPELRRLKMYGRKFKDIQGNTGLPLLQELCRTSNSPSMVKILLEDCLWSSSVEDRMGNSLLHHAAMGNSVGVAEFLIAFGALVSKVNAANETPLHIAVIYGCKNVAELLLGKGANLELRNATGLTPICCAFMNGNIEMAKLLRLHRAECNISFNGITLLLLSLRNGDDTFVDFLLDEVNIDPNERVDGCDIDCLNVAVRWSSRRIIEKLLDRRVNQMSVDLDGYIPLQVAAMKKRLDIVELLMTGIPTERRFIDDWRAEPIASHCAGVQYTRHLLLCLNAQIASVIAYEKEGKYQAAFDLFQQLDMLYGLRSFHFTKMSVYAQKLNDHYRARAIAMRAVMLAELIPSNAPERSKELAKAIFTVGITDEYLMEHTRACDAYTRASQLEPANAMYAERMRKLGR